MTLVEEHVSEVPSQLRRAIKTLSEEARLAILIVLLKNGEMTFSELSRAVDMSSSNLTHHLRKLVQAALVENYFQRRQDSEEYSFYKGTVFAEDFARNVLGVLDYTSLLESALVQFQKPITYPVSFESKMLQSTNSESELLLHEQEKHGLPLLPRLNFQTPYTQKMPQEYEVTVKRTVTEFKFKIPTANIQQHLEEIKWK